MLNSGSLGVSLLRGRLNMANVDVGVWRPAKSTSQSRSNTAIKSNSAVRFSDDDLASLPTDHPVRELITFSVFVLGVVTFLVWGGSKLLKVIF